MKIIKLLFVICVLLIIHSCRHNVHYEGFVYSKHNYPVANARVRYQYTMGSRTDGGIRETRTDSEGFFKLKNSLARNENPSKFMVSSDSGEYSGGAGSNNTQLKIYLK